MRFDWELAAILGGGVFGPVLLMAGIVGGAFYLDYKSCEHTAALYRVEYIWGPLIRCQMQINGKWVPFGNYRAIESIKR